MRPTAPTIRAFFSLFRFYIACVPLMLTAAVYLPGPRMSHKQPPPLTLLLIFALLSASSACATAEIPSTAPADIATIVAATQKAAPTHTPSPVVSPTATMAPTLTFTPVPGTPAAPTRVDLSGGATSASLSSQIGAGETAAYAFRGAQAEPLLLSLTSGAGDATLFLMSQGGTYFLRPGRSTSWRGTLPQAGNYFVGVYGGAMPTDYALSLQLVQRIRFKEGATTAAVSGRTPRGTTATYSVFAIKGETLVLTLSSADGKAALAVSGFVDGQTYLSASEKEYQIKLPAPRTQDYIVEVVPLTGESVFHILDVQVD
jgi:hypothetical protein